MVKRKHKPLLNGTQTPATDLYHRMLFAQHLIDDKQSVKNISRMVSMEPSTIYEWARWIKSGKFSVKVKERRLQSQNEIRMLKLLEALRNATGDARVKELEELKISPLTFDCR